MTTAATGGDRVDYRATRWRQSDLVSDFPAKRHLNECVFVCNGEEKCHVQSEKHRTDQKQWRWQINAMYNKRSSFHSKCVISIEM